MRTIDDVAARGTRQRTGARWRPLAVVVAVAGLLLAACGSSSTSQPDTTDVATEPGGGESANAMLARASESTSVVETGRIRMRMRFSGQEGGETMSADITSEGTFADQGRAMSLTTDMTPLLQAAAQGDPDAPSSFVLRQIQLGTEMFMKIETDPPLPDNPDTWIRMDLADLVEEDALGQAGQGIMTGGPGAYLEMLRAQGVTVQEDGTDEIDGARVTVFSGEVDTEAAIARAKPEVADEMRRAFRQSGMGSMPFKVYIDDDGLVRRTEMTMSQRQGGTSAEVVAVMELYDFGAPSTIEAPPAEQVTDAAELGVPMFGGQKGSA